MQNLDIVGIIVNYDILQGWFILDETVYVVFPICTSQIVPTKFALSLDLDVSCLACLA